MWKFKEISVGVFDGGIEEPPGLLDVDGRLTLEWCGAGEPSRLSDAEVMALIPPDTEYYQRLARGHVCGRPDAMSPGTTRTEPGTYIVHGYIHKDDL